MSKYVIGLDLGINNVGWSIVDYESKKLEKMGVRTFNVSSKSQDRRSFRVARRLRKRAHTREKDLLSLFDKIDFPSFKTQDSNLLDKRVKGLHEKIEKQDIVNICCYFVTHRGYIPFGDEERELIQLEGQYPCQYYQELLKKNNKFRALNEVVDNKDLRHELEQILKTQTIFYENLFTIIEDIFNIFTRKREYWEGPGSINSFTPYGRFKNPEDVEQYLEMQKKGQEKYIYDDLIGKCSVIPFEKTTVISNFYYEVYALLNDFINTSITNCDRIRETSQHLIYQDNKTGYYKLTPEGLEKVIQYCAENTKLTYLQIYKHVLGNDIKKDDLSGYRKDKKNNPEFSTLNIYRFVKKILLDNDCDIEWLNYKNDDSIHKYNKILEIFAQCPGFVEVKKTISKNEEEFLFTEEEYNALKKLYLDLKKKDAFRYGAFCEKHLKRAIMDMKNNGLNYMSVSKKYHYDREMNEMFLKKYHKTAGIQLMDVSFVDNLIASPQVKKSLRQTIKVINAIILEKGDYPEIICIESTKDMNGTEAKLAIEKKQRQEEVLNVKAKKLLEEHYDSKHITPINIEKTKLFLEIDGRCPYCNNPFVGGLNSIIKESFHIEHILPISKTGDDSYDNKTIACIDCNSKKSYMTPYQWMQRDEFELFESRIKNLKISDEKKRHFLETKDVNKYSQRFMNRNLRDTAYGTKELIRQIQIFNLYLEKTIPSFKKINTLSTPGFLTHNIRKKLNIDKNRDAGKFHHAVDATIIAYIALDEDLGTLLLEMQNMAKFWLNKNKVKDFEFNIGTMIRNYNPQITYESIKNIDSDDKINLSTQVLKDPNKGLANANIIKFIKKGDKFYKVSQISNIYELKGENEIKKLEVLFNTENDKARLMIQDNNPKMFEKLKAIYNSTQYRHEKENPFVNYCLELMDKEEKFDYRKHGIKQDNGPVIIKLRYYENCNDPILLEKENIKKKENTYIGLDNGGQYCTKLYWDLENNKFIFFPIYCISVNLTTGKINKKDRVYRNLYDKHLKDKNYQFITNLYNGDYIEVVKSDDSLVCGNISCYHKAADKICLKNEASFTKSDRQFTLYDVDMLGNLKTRLTWPQK